jgi:hypothetical protein
MTVEALAELRDRLAAMREDLVGRLIARIDGGEIALLGCVGAALRVRLDDELLDQTSLV